MTEYEEEMMDGYVEREIITFRVMENIIRIAPGLMFKMSWLHDAFITPLHRLVNANGVRAKENTSFLWTLVCVDMVVVMLAAIVFMSTWEVLVAILLLFSLAFWCLAMSIGKGCGDDLSDHQAGLVLIDTKENLEWFYDRVRRILPTQASVHALNYYPDSTSSEYEPYVRWVEFLYNAKEL